METKTKYLGNKKPFEGLDIVESEYPPDRVRLTSDEVSALCPVTGQPDLYTVSISYEPGEGRIIETKSLKMYFQTFRDKGIFAEDLCGVICTQIWPHLYPAYIQVEVRQKSRGGITTYASIEKYRFAGGEDD